MTKDQAEKMVATLEALAMLAVLPLSEQFYEPEQGCEQDVEKIVQVYTTQGEEWLDDEGDFSRWAKIEILTSSTFESRTHYERIWKALQGFEGLDIISYRRPHYARAAVPYIIVDLAKHEHLRGAF